MSEGANSLPQICENSLTTLKGEIDPEELPPRTISHTTRRPRFGTGNVPLSPYIVIDGRKLRSSLALSKKKLPRRVSFPTNDNHLISGYLEPANPWKLAENVNHEDLISAYKESCIKHNATPLETVISQLQNLDTVDFRNEELNLKGTMLDVSNTEPLEEIFKRVQFDKIDLEATSLSDETSVILFDMLEYYESAKHLNISCNHGIGIHGWQACANMIRKTQRLEHLEAKNVLLNEQYMNIFSRALRSVCHLRVLKLGNCGLSGRSIVTLVAALKMNTGIRELYLADNGLNLYDAIQLGSLLRLNSHIQLLDISNNVIQDDGLRDILEGLINQINEDKDGKGLNILILWNNQLTKKSSPYFARIIALSKTLETLNIGKNMLTDELLFIIKDSLKKNHVLLQLGMQSTEITCDGIVTLSEIITVNQMLQRIDVRNNCIQLTGIKALASAMKKNRSITKIDLDDTPDMKVDDLTEILHQYTQLVAEIRSCCLENEKTRTLEENNEGFESSYHNKLCSTTFRKISLTCQTLPYSSSPTISIQKSGLGQSVVQPKHINGGYLRSPTHTPASSPVVSPILSPSRSRFVVSRVPETLPSTESSVVLSSPGSSPACVVTTGGSSRFRVSVVETANAVSLPKSVFTTTEAGIARANLEPKLHVTESTESDDSDNVFGLELEINKDKAVESVQNISGNVFQPDFNVVEVCTSSTPVRVGGLKSFVSVTCAHSDSSTLEPEKDVNVPDSQPILATRKIDCIANGYNNDDTGVIKVDETAQIETDNISTHSKVDDTINKVMNTCTNPSTEFYSQTKQDPMQKTTSNLGKLLSLFQHSSCFFSESTSINQLKSKSTLQGSINSMMSLGDKFHYYIKDKKDRIYNREVEQSTLSIKNKSKFFNVSQLPSLQSLASMISSFRFDSNLSGSEQNNKGNYCSNEEDCLFEKECTDKLIAEVAKECADDNSENKEVRHISVLPSDGQLSENENSEITVAIINKDIVLAANCIVSNIIDTCSKIVNDNLLMYVANSNTNVPVPKPIGIPEFFFKIDANDLQNGNVAEILEKVGPILIKGKHHETLTDSINFTSDSNSLSCSIIYDVNNDVHTVHKQNRMHNFIILNLGTKDNLANDTIFNVHSTERYMACFLCNRKCVCNVNNKSLQCYNNVLKVDVKANCLTKPVTKFNRVGSNSFQNAHINLNVPCDLEQLNVNSSIYWNISNISNVLDEIMSKVNRVDNDGNSSNLYTSQFCKSVYRSMKFRDVDSSLTKSLRYCKICKVYETQHNNSAVKSYIYNIPRNENISATIPRMYSYMTSFNAFTLRELIHQVAEISINGSPVKRISIESTPNNLSTEIFQIRTSSYDISERSKAPMVAMCEKTENSDCENEFVSDHSEEKNCFHKKYRLEDNDVLGINSKYSIYPRRDVTSSIDNNVGSNNLLENISVMRTAGSNVAHVKHTNLKDKIETTDQYLNAIECAVATTICSTVVGKAGSNLNLDINSDQSTNIAETPTVIRRASTNSYE